MPQLLVCMLILFFFPLGAYSQFPKLQDALDELDSVIELRNAYEIKKDQKIQSLKERLHEEKTRESLPQQYELISLILEEYETYIYDSAYVYTQKLYELAKQMKDPGFIRYAQLKSGYVLLTAGMYKEALDTLEMLQIPFQEIDLDLAIRSNTAAPKSQDVMDKVMYFNYLARAYFDLAAYHEDDLYSNQYQNLGSQYCDSVVDLVGDESPQSLGSKAFRSLQLENYPQSRDLYRKLKKDFTLSEHEKAMTNTSLGRSIQALGDTSEAMLLYIHAAIQDIKTATKETSALKNLAELLYQKGYVEYAHRYILLAWEDAKFFGARQRTLQLSPLIPLIELEKLKKAERQTNRWYHFALVFTGLCLVILVFALIIFVQNKRLERARKDISQSHDELSLLNEQLQENNRIKEEYIAYYFSLSSRYIEHLDEIKNQVLDDLLNKRYDQIKKTARKLDPKNERKELFHNFDIIFLKIFPDFIEKFNLLFEEKDRISPSEGSLLNTDLRIYALIRMGLSDNAQIAKILNFSVNTIYAYKTKIKNKSRVPNEGFEAHILAIPSV